MKTFPVMVAALVVAVLAVAVWFLVGGDPYRSSGDGRGNTARTGPTGESLAASDRASGEQRSLVPQEATPARLLVEVVGMRTAIPQRDVMVEAVSGDLKLSGVSDSRGGLVLEPAAEGSWHVTAVGSRASVAVDTRGGGDRRIQLRVAEMIHVEGIVVDPDGAPAAGAAIFRYDRVNGDDRRHHVARSGADGRFRATCPGEAYLFAELRPHALSGGVKLASVDALGIELRLRKSLGPAQVRVHRSGSPVADGRVDLTLREGLVRHRGDWVFSRSRVSGRTDSRGMFRSNRLRSGAWRTVISDGRTLVTALLAADGTEFDVDLDSYDERVRGVVVADGIPVPDLALTLRGESALHPGWSITTDESGRFRFDWQMLDRKHQYVRVLHESERGRIDQRFEDLGGLWFVELIPNDCLKGRVDMSTWEESMSLSVADDYDAIRVVPGADGSFAACLRGRAEFVVRHPDYAVPLLYLRMDDVPAEIEIRVPPPPACARGLDAEVAWNGAPLQAGEWILIPEHRQHGMLVLPVSVGRVACRLRVPAGVYRSGVRLSPSGQWIEGGRVHVVPGGVQRFRVAYEGREWRVVEFPTDGLQRNVDLDIVHPEVGFGAGVDPAVPIEWYQPPGPVRIVVRGEDGGILDTIDFDVPPGTGRFVLRRR